MDRAVLRPYWCICTHVTQHYLLCTCTFPDSTILVGKVKQRVPGEVKGTTRRKRRRNTRTRTRAEQEQQEQQLYTHRHIVGKIGPGNIQQEYAEAYNVGTLGARVCDSQHAQGDGVPADGQWWNLLSEADSHADRVGKSVSWLIYSDYLWDFDKERAPLLFVFNAGYCQFLCVIVCYFKWCSNYYT